jgi:hypothetical protein
VSANRFARVLDALVRHEVRFIVVGGVAAVLQRVPITTVDFDILHDRSPDNVERLLETLWELEATYRDDPRNLAPQASHLLGPGSQLLRVGVLDLDVLGAVDPGLVYHLALRQAEGFLRSLASRLELDLPIPDHTTLSRRARKLGKIRNMMADLGMPESYCVG